MGGGTAEASALLSGAKSASQIEQLRSEADMILVTGTVVVIPENRAAFLDAARRQVISSRQEPGCISYHCGEDAFAPGSFTFVEKWRDGEALQIHFAKDYSIEFASAARRLAANVPIVEIHDVAGVRTVTPRA